MLLLSCEVHAQGLVFLFRERQLMSELAISKPSQHKQALPLHLW